MVDGKEYGVGLDWWLNKVYSRRKHHREEGEVVIDGERDRNESLVMRVCGGGVDAAMVVAAGADGLVLGLTDSASVIDAGGNGGEEIVVGKNRVVDEFSRGNILRVNDGGFGSEVAFETRDEAVSLETTNKGNVDEEEGHGDHGSCLGQFISEVDERGLGSGDGEEEFDDIAASWDELFPDDNVRCIGGEKSEFVAAPNSGSDIGVEDGEVDEEVSCNGLGTDIGASEDVQD